MRHRGWLVLIAILLALTGCRHDGPPAADLPGAAHTPASGAATSFPTQYLRLPTVTALATPTATPSPTWTPSPTLTPTPTPTPTTVPGELLSTARRAREFGDYAAASHEFGLLLTAAGANDEEQRAALLGLTDIHLRAGEFADAERTASDFLARYPEGEGAEMATLWLAQARRGQMDWTGALEAFEAYLALDATLVAYISDLMADCYHALGDTTAAVEAYEAALTGAATSDKVIAIRERLAQAYMAAGEIDAAMAQYDTVATLTDDSNALARMDYLAGYALIVGGRAEEGYRRYLHAVESYPAAYDSYLALVTLVEVGYPVDDFQRGLVDYNAKAYVPAITAFYRHMEADPYGHPGDAHLFVARCYAALGNFPSALAELDVLIGTHLGDALWNDGWLEKAAIQAASGDRQAAVQTLLAFADGNPADPLTPTAIRRAAALRERDGVWIEAHELYRRLAASYPGHADASDALFRAGLTAYRAGEKGVAVQDWDALVRAYPDSDWSAPALLWLIKSLPAEEAAGYAPAVAALPPDSYYAIRAAEVVSRVLPFTPPAAVVWPDPAQESADRARAETWLGDWLGADLNPDLSPAIADDPRWERGLKLWELGLTDEARAELNGLRYDLRQDPVASYQLALAFREIGLYRSSILAANAVIRLSGARSPLQVPPFLARLAYPVYYAELIQKAALDHGVDPLLLLAMIRQESLFESVARSWAAAQGLMQIIPSTGEDIARALRWPDFRNEDLYRPYVNVPFGAFYLADQLRVFDQDPYAALSAYNGGPGNASYWWERAPNDPDLYVEVVNLDETRRYIQLVFTHYAYYRALYGAGE